MALGRARLLSGPLGVHAGAKLGAAWRRLTVVGDPARTEGLVIGPSLALRGRIVDTVVQLTVDALYQSFEELTMYGSSAHGTDEDGLRLSVRFGVVLPLRIRPARPQFP